MQIILTVRDNGAVISYRASRYLRSAINEAHFDDRKYVLTVVSATRLLSPSSARPRERYYRWCFCSPFAAAIKSYFSKESNPFISSPRLSCLKPFKTSWKIYTGWSIMAQLKNTWFHMEEHNNWNFCIAFETFSLKEILTSSLFLLKLKLWKKKLSKL